MMDWKVLLASGSPRRKELLTQAGVDFSCPALRQVDESFDADMDVRTVPVFLARLKSDAHKDLVERRNILLTADTIVVLDGRILGKPKDRAEAISMLRALSGMEHSVITGVVLRTVDMQREFSVESVVKFAILSDEQIEYYVDNFNPYDKAGGYGIQDWIGAIGVESVFGSYYNVVGLPIQRVYTEINKIKNQ